MHKLSYGLIILVLLLFAGLFWMERQAQTDLQHRLSEWTSRSVRIDALSLGLFESEMTNIYIPTDDVSRFTNDIEVGSIKIEYSPTELTDNLTVLQSVAVNQLTIHWNGLLGRNIHELINQVRDSFPKRRQHTKEQSDSTIQINNLTLYNTTAVLGHACRLFRCKQSCYTFTLRSRLRLIIVFHCFRLFFQRGDR